MADSMEGVVTAAEEPKTESVEQKAIADIRSNFVLLERAVAQFDTRFTLRALRSISSLRKRLTDRVLCSVIILTYSPNNATARTFIEYIGMDGEAIQSVVSQYKEEVQLNKNNTKEPLPEVDVYIAILIQVYLYDQKEFEEGAEFAESLVDKIRELNRRTLDSLAAKAYFYFSLFHEEMDPKPPSKQSPVINIRGKLLAALRSAVLRKDPDTQASVTTLLLRNYLSTADITQADLLVAQTQFPPNAPNNQVARYLYYLGRIRAIQLSYTEAHEHLVSATRKSPSAHCATGFYQASMKLLCVVELLMGDIPEREVFSQPRLERAMEPYFRLVQAVRVGDLQGFLKVVQQSSSVFHRDGTYTLILRLRQNVIKTGIRMLSLSYSRISLRDICIRLGLESEESAEYIVAKAIRDGVIEASIDHEKGFMQTKVAGDVYATREPGEAFHERIQACLTLHDECVKAMRYPMNQHRLELKNAQEARERERELAKEIQDGDIDEDDAAGDFEGLIDVSRRLRRAILLDDLSLVKRIIRNNPKYIRNPDFDDRSNTSLHLAAKHGFTTIAEYLVDVGHEDGMISRNNDWETPLMLAAMSGKEECGVYLAKRFPECVGWKNKAGLDALMLACKSGSGTLHFIPTLIVHGPSILSACDDQGNTALHHASAAGELKALRMLLQYGANPLASNSYSWTPVHYSATGAAEAYFKALIIEFEKKKAEGKRAVKERERQRTGGVRLVTDAEGLNQANAATMHAAGGERLRARDDAAIAGLPAPGMDWSPVEKRRAMTPTEGRGWAFTSDGVRPRAETGESI
ncbi:26s proteasome non-atpase regulatory subunit 3 [Stemphylium lycopersici]|uniref:26s proteasome non-atpase regulatory subunit 3 n=1 Tax=Stemphylium lycopersici TaxID=183478 RepID=A0A364MXD5_STELY|nr:26s proteasome non-atpase regulatory subunit 3 [Stemphylium lycopersici]RAR06413.1 26s proteasome non-atpase regulatory subunit 3 [Stemphylium lycopersici]RAR11935.1 26s proteasome non-atpase regulatory subunit 3 [Stemphylium lycopersici]